MADGGFRSETVVAVHSCFRIETVAVQTYNGCMKRPFPNGQKRPLGCKIYVTAVAAGQSQFLCGNLYA
jgi:hypothetical protein